MINRLKYTFFVVLFVALAGTCLTTEAQRRRPVRSAPTVGQNVRALINRIENNASLFQNSFNRSSNVNSGNYGNDFNRQIGDFRSAAARVRQDYNARLNVSNDVQTLINFASNIDNYLQSNPLDATTQSYWASIRPDLNQLSRIYGISYRTSAQNYPTYNQGGNFPSNNQGNFPNNQSGYNSNNLTGTYRLNSSRSDRAADAADRATRTLPYRDRQDVRDNLLRRLESPDALAIDVRGNTVTIASSRAPQFTFDADGRERVEQTPNGRTIRASASLYNNQLIVNSVGDRSQDYSVTFETLEGGRRLRVTRRVSSDRLSQPVIVQSFYDKTADIAQFDVYNGTQQGGYNNGNTNNTTATNTNDFYIPNDTQLTAVLNENVSTKTSREGDRFTMTVRDPSQYNGAIIEGYVSRVNPSGRITGRSQLSLNFERIRFNGNSYNFAGIISSIRTTNGEDARVDNEGTVQEGSSQTTKTEQRAAIGTGLGAIIGAIAGGGKGAVIGAVIGAGGGAGSVYAQGRNDLDLASGTEVTIRASAPASFGR